MLAGVSVEYYTRLERGNFNGVSESVPESRAKSLALDDAEQPTCSTSPAPREPAPGQPAASDGLATMIGPAATPASRSPG
jgi:hypothetical protein